MLLILFFVLASLKIVFEVYLAVKFSKIMIRLPDRFLGEQTPRRFLYMDKHIGFPQVGDFEEVLNTAIP